MVLCDGSKTEKNFETEIAEWKRDGEVDDESDAGDDVHYCVASSDSRGEIHLVENYAVELVKKEEYESIEVQEAMKSELEKYRAFGAYEEVEDVGQHRIPIRWVITKQVDNGKNQPIKARLCIRGDLEKNKFSIRSDSPTAAKETLKIALMIAANEGFVVKSVDIKSAYLQGNDLKRDIYVRPPIESNSKKL